MNQGTFLDFMDPEADPRMDPERQILGDPCQIKAFQGPIKVHIDQVFTETSRQRKNLNVKPGLRSISHSVPEK